MKINWLSSSESLSGAPASKATEIAETGGYKYQCQRSNILSMFVKSKKAELEAELEPK